MNPTRRGGRRLPSMAYPLLLPPLLGTRNHHRRRGAAARHWSNEVLLLIALVTFLLLLPGRVGAQASVFAPGVYRALPKPAARAIALPEWSSISGVMDCCSGGGRGL